MAVPTGFQATSYSYNTINLSWTNTDVESRITIQRREASGIFGFLADLDPATSSYSDTSCSRNTHYYYQICYSGQEYSDSVNAWTYPQPPSSLAVSWSGKTATLTWTVNGTYTYIQVQYKLSADSTWTTETSTLDGAATTDEITVSTESASYGFRVRAYYLSSTLWSEYTSLLYQVSGVMAPTGMLLTSSTTTAVLVSWVDNSSVEDGYEVWMDQELIYTTAADATSYNKTGLSEATEYDFKVRAKDGTAYSAFTTEQSIYTGAVPDVLPTIGTVTVVSQTALTVSWTCAATNEDGYYIYRSTDGTTYTQVGTAVEDATSYADTGLASYTLYYYKVRAYNAYGLSDLSGAASGTTTIDLDPPTALIADATSSTSITITFTVNAGNATSHEVSAKSSGGSYSVLGSTASGTIATYTYGALTADTEYTFRIRAYSSVSTGYGEYSAPVTKKTLSLGTDTVRRNEAFFAMGNVLCIASETPQTSFEAYWRSKPMDFSEADPMDANKFKTVYLVQLEYEDTYASVPIVVSLSTDGGTTWVTSTETVGTGDLTDKIHHFYFSGVTGKYITLKISSTDDDTGFTWTGLIIYYVSRGEYQEVD